MSKFFKTVRAELPSKSVAQLVENGCNLLTKLPFLEINGMEIPCQRKTAALLRLCKRMQDEPGKENLNEFAAIMSMIQPKRHESHVSEKTFKSNIRTLCGEEISIKKARRLKKLAIECANIEVASTWQSLEDSYRKKWLKDPQDDADIFFDYLQSSDTPLVTAVYLGSPTLDDVMQHKFQYLFETRFCNKRKRFYADPNFIDGQPRGIAPSADEPKALIHLGVPNAIYNMLSGSNFKREHPDCEPFEQTAFSKLNLSAIDLKQAMRFSFNEMKRIENLEREPGLGAGEFRYPFSIYHFSCSPSWPIGGQEEFLGTKLNNHQGIELKADLHRESYANTQFSPLEIYPIYPNKFLGDFAPLPGFEFSIVKKSHRITLRLVASLDTVFAKPNPIMREQRYQYHEGNQTMWHWNLQESGLFVQEHNGQGFEPKEISDKQAQAFYEVIWKVLNSHLEINFCYKTRWLINEAGINSQVLESGCLNKENALIFHNNWLKRVHRENNQ